MSGGQLRPKPDSRGLMGGVISLVGQAVRGERQGSGWDRGMETNGQYNNQQYADPYSCQYKGRTRRGGRNGSDRKGGLISTPIKNLLKKNVLYLMVVNMPSDEKMAAAKAAFQT